MLRFPVVYKNKPYTPIKLSRCKKFVAESKAIWRKDIETYEYLRKYIWYKKKFWSEGSFICTIGNASEETIRKYIESQG